MRRSLYFAAAAAAALVSLGAGLAAQEAQKPATNKPTIKRVPITSLTSTDGAELFRAFCSVCHGTGGKGDGPAAKALKTPPADLTTITKRHGQFPTKTIESTILGDIEPVDPAHGTREMPMWGPIFRSAADRDVATLATANLLKYLESLQVK